MITLRSNQEEPVRKAIEFFNQKNPRPSLIVLPTAWGKSILTAFVAQSCQDRILVLQPSKELLEQNIKKYHTLCGGFAKDAGIYSASFGRKEIAPITYATIGSIKNLGAQFKEYGFTKALIDEAHLYPREADSMIGRFLRDSEITHVLGITATPVKLQQNYDINGNVYSKLVMLTNRSKKGNFYKDIICIGQVKEMVELGFWSKLKYDVAAFDGSLLEFNNAKSEYTEESVTRSFQANGGAAAITSFLDSVPHRRHILVFCPSVEDAVNLSKCYPLSGVVHGDMPKKERAKVIERFRSGQLRVLFNVRVLTTGFDYTGIDCIVLAISTASVALYYQIVGRATRIDPSKRDALIYDLGGNVERFGRVEDITYEKDTMWRMYGTGGKLLSGVPIYQMGRVTRKDIEEEHKQKSNDIIEVMPFGKHKDVPLKDVPMDYKWWMLKNFKWDRYNENLRKSIIATM